MRKGSRSIKSKLNNNSSWPPIMEVWCLLKEKFIINFIYEWKGDVIYSTFALNAGEIEFIPSGTREMQVSRYYTSKSKSCDRISLITLNSGRKSHSSDSFYLFISIIKWKGYSPWMIACELALMISIQCQFGRHINIHSAYLLSQAEQKKHN